EEKEIMHAPQSIRVLIAAIFLAAVGSWMVLPAATQVYAAASLKVSRTALPAGDALTVSGAGFTADDDVVVSTNVTVQGQTKYVASASHTDGSGAFTAQMTIPAGTAEGAYKVMAKDFHGHIA